MCLGSVRGKTAIVALKPLRLVGDTVSQGLLAAGTEEGAGCPGVCQQPVRVRGGKIPLRVLAGRPFGEDNFRDGIYSTISP